MAALPNIGGALCSMLQSLADAPIWVPCNNAVNIGKRKTWTQSEFCTWQSSITGQEPPKMNIWCTSPGDGQRSCKVWLASVERHGCSNAAKTRSPLKFAGVPQTTEPISAASRPKFTILWGHVGRYYCLTSFFQIVDACLSCKDIVRKSCATVPRWWIFWRFLGHHLPMT